MSTIIDSLIVTLGIDSSGFKDSSKKATEASTELRREFSQTQASSRSLSNSVQRDQNQLSDNSRRTARSMQESGGSASGFFSKIRNEAIMMLGVFTAGVGLASFAKNTINAASTTGILSKQIGVNVNQLNAMEAAAQRAGASSGVMSKQLESDAKKAAQVKAGASVRQTYGDKFFQFGGDFANMKNAESQLKEYARIYENIKKKAIEKGGMSDPQATAFASQQITEVGLSKELIPLISKGTDSMQAQIAMQMKKVAMTEKDAKAARRAKESWFDLTQQFELTGQRVVLSLIPTLERLTKWLGKIKIPPAVEMSKTIDEWVTKIEPFFTTIENGLDELDDFVETIGGWSTVLKGLIGLKLASWTIGLMSLTSGLLGFSTAAASAGSAASVAKFGIGSLLALGAAAAAGTAVGTWAYETGTPEQQTKWQNTLGQGVARTMALFGNEEAKEAVFYNSGGTNQTSIENPPKVGAKKSDRMRSVFDSFTNAGFSPAQSKALTAEVGREGDFAEKYIFGSHVDAANNAVNTGFFSWQGDRGTKLRKRLKKKGLLTKSGNIKRTQGALNEQALFAKEEMESGKYKRLAGFMGDKNIGSEDAAKKLGKGYIKWAYGQSKLRSGRSFDWKSHDRRRAKYYAQIDAITKEPRIDASEKLPMPPPRRVGKGVKDIHGKVIQSDEPIPLAPTIPTIPTIPKSMMVSKNMQSMNNQKNDIIINVKSTDPKQAAQEIKTTLNESLTTNFASGML